MNDQWTFPLGMVVAGRYKLTKELGFGGMGAVFEAMDLLLERSVAIKFLDPALDRNEEHIIRFHREALAAGRIGHPNICDVRDRGITNEGHHFIVMELLEGFSLFRLFQIERVIPPQRLIPIILEVLSALGAAHRVGIIHRDLKPENIFIARDGQGRERVKLLDFGVSRFLEDANEIRITKTGKIVGTPLYVSPEQALAERDLDERTDLWSVGVILYEALTGRSPFMAKNPSLMLIKVIRHGVVPPRKLSPWISPELEAVILKALEKERNERYQDAQSFAADLRRAFKGEVRSSS